MKGEIEMKNQLGLNDKIEKKIYHKLRLNDEIENKLKIYKKTNNNN